MAKPAIALMISKRPKHAAFDAPEEESPLEFKAPEGFDLEGKQPGDTVEAVVQLTVGDDGMLSIKSLNGIPMKGGDDDDMHKPFDDQEDENKGGFVNNAMPGDDGAEEEGM